QRFEVRGDLHVPAARIEPRVLESVPVADEHPGIRGIAQTQFQLEKAPPEMQGAQQIPQIAEQTRPGCRHPQYPAGPPEPDPGAFALLSPPLPGRLTLRLPFPSPGPSPQGKANQAEAPAN